MFLIYNKNNETFCERNSDDTKILYKLWRRVLKMNWLCSMLKERLSNHFPAVVMMLTEWRDREELIYAQDKIHYMYDKGSHSSYFYTQVDTRTSLVVIFESKKSEKDSYVNNFMNDIATQLRCTKFFTSLKPGSKWNKQLKQTRSDIYFKKIHKLIRYFNKIIL